jgi:hypothetical protein
VNHKGQVLPYHVRERAADVELVMNNWDQDATPLEEYTQGVTDKEVYLHDRDGWDY